MEMRKVGKTMMTRPWDAPCTEVYRMEKALDIEINRKDLKEIREEVALPINEFTAAILTFVEDTNEVFV